MSDEIHFFETPNDLRDWFNQNADQRTEAWIGFHKKGTGNPSITWEESVDEALCVGWIDGIRKSIDDTAYKIRFTPRKPTSIWSAVNIANVEKLIAQGRMQPAGLKAFELRKENKSGVYSHEQRPQSFDAETEAIFRTNEKAWAYFQSKAPSYQRAAIWWVISAKQQATRDKRLATLIEDSENERMVKQFISPTPKKG